MPSISYNQNGIGLREAWSAGRPVYENSTSSTITSGSTQATAGKDSVTLSKDASLAYTREKLGHSGRGRLSKKDMELQAYNDQTDVEDKIEKAMKELHLRSDSTVTITRDDDGNVLVAENFQEKEELENLLNEDKEFLKKFNRLSANTEILNYTENIMTGSAKVSLASILNGETDKTGWDSLFNIADTFKAMKSSKDPLEMISTLSRKAIPFELIYTSR